MDFYMELTSHSEFYRDNTASSFRCRIQPSISLKHLKNGPWEVTLTEIALPNVRNVKNSTITTIQGQSKHEYTVNTGYYDDPEHLLAAVGALRIPNVVLRYNKVTKKVYYSIPVGMKLKFSTELGVMLGFEAKEYSGRGYTENIVDVFRGIKPILFQTPIISPQIFRESRRPILKSLYQGGGELTAKYCKVVDTSLEEIDFNLTDIYNNRVDFLPGSVDFTLHFRPCNQA